MTQVKQARIGAVFFGLWGILHVVGGVSILAALSSGPDAGYAFYGNSTGPFPEVTGAALGYLAFLITVSGFVVAIVAWRLNWRNSPLGLGLNSAVVGIFDLGLIFFLVRPGHVSPLEASLGIVLFLAAISFGGMACRTHTESA